MNNGAAQKGNWVNIRPLIYQSIHVAGYVAGTVSAGPHCFMAPMRYSEVYQAIDAYTLGIQRARGPDATLEVTFIGKWFDTDLETAASRMLLERGCEVVSLYTDTPLPLRIFSAAGKLGIGVVGDTLPFFPIYCVVPVDVAYKALLNYIALSFPEKRYVTCSERIRHTSRPECAC